MKKPLKIGNVRLPPQLTMAEYCDFIDESLKYVKPDQVARQKAIEKRILRPFSLTDDPRKSGG